MGALKLESMELVVVAALLLAVGYAFSRSLGRATELCHIRVRAGKVEFVRGRMPIRLRHEIDDVLVRERVQDAELRLRVEAQQARLVASGLSGGTLQQLRNVIGRYPLAKLRSGPTVR